MTEPTGTYRVQLRPEFGFDQAASIVDYLVALGVSHLYCSPYLQAAPGSTHGYDVVDYGWVNQELGGAEGHQRLHEALVANGLGQVLDVVPNHMATRPENGWWWDVLQNGPSSRYADYFDIDWYTPEWRLRNKILLPILETHYGRVIDARKIRLLRQGAAFQISCPGHVLPVTPDSLDLLLFVAAGRSGSDELESIAAALGRLPPGTVTEPDAVRERERDGAVLLGALARLLDEQPEVAAAVDATMAAVNGEPGTLHALLERQSYRLAYWRTAGRDLPYRRFFDINTLIGLNMQREEVFAATHVLVLRWLAAGILDGVRIDHPDGLRDPEGYLIRLRSRAPEAWVVVEKILQPGEPLRRSWPVAGTTGYEFCNRVNGLFVDPAAERPMTELYEEVTGEGRGFEEIALEAKHLVMETVLASDLNRLTELLVQICEQHRRYRDYTRHELHEAVKELIACLPVYRTYVDADRRRLDPEDRATIAATAERAQSRRRDLDPELFVFLFRLLTLDVTGRLEGELVMRLQQTSSAVMAKGVEDTAFYRYHRLVSLNEVGGSPGMFGVTVDDFHDANAGINRSWPGTMLTLSTHDTKRGADVRARLNVLSEVPDRWADAVWEWMKINERHRTRREGAEWPDRNVEYLFYQTLVGAYPLEEDRALSYLQKASKEAKEHTSWTDPNPVYDEALAAFVKGVMGDEQFQRELRSFVEPLWVAGWVNGLAQTLLLLTSPGVPDVYQGTELWDLSLVDPDNRRLVDFGLRRELLERVRRARPEDLWSQVASGAPKLAVIQAALRVRRRLPGPFRAGSEYLPLSATGPAAGRVVAFSRGGAVITVVPRLVLGLMGDGAGGRWELSPEAAWQTVIELPAGRWKDEISGREHSGPVALGDLLDVLPVALLVRSRSLGEREGFAADGLAGAREPHAGGASLS
ncbi:MAG TPA: malto-oligosyltrehalose synthase [Actinomycetota bacterium]|nr:malto-oligosyltrehalose synthase [Actinomycetota bacterium]